MSHSSDTVYVLGSGASLAQLSAAERAHIAKHPSVGMNKYLLFWDIIGVFPSHFFLADIHYPALRVYEESVARAREAGRPLHYLIDQTYRRRYGGGPLKRLANLPFRLGQWYAHGYWYAPEVTAEPVTYFKRCHRWAAPQEWGESLDDLMYFYRGSLSVLLNLLTVLNLGRHIKLLGVDLNAAGSFYDEAIQQKPYLFDQYRSLQEQPGAQHVTAQTYQGMPGIQARWDFIQGNVEQRGYTLRCCNPESLLVTEGLCPHAPVIE